MINHNWFFVTLNDGKMKTDLSMKTTFHVTVLCAIIILDAITEEVHDVGPRIRSMYSLTLCMK